jgi:ATP-binding cassette subfamily B protein
VPSIDTTTDMPALPGTKTLRPHATLSLLRKGLPFIAPYTRPLVGVAALALAMALASASEPLAMRYLLDGLTQQVFAEFALAVVWIGALALCKEGLSALLDTAFWRVRIGVNYGITRATVERLHSLPLSYHRDESVGAIMTKMDRGITGFVTAFHELFYNLFPAFLYLAIALTFMLHMDVPLTLLVLAFAPLAPILGARASAEQTSRERMLFERWTKIFSRFNEVLSGIVVVKSFAMEEAEKRRFLAGCEAANAIVIRGVRTDARVTAAKNATVACARIAAIAYGGYRVFHGQMTIGTLVAFVGFIGGLFQPIQAMVGIYQTLRRGTVALETIFEILDAQDSLGDAPDAEDAGLVRGEVEFRDVAFAYRPGTNVLDGVSFTARPGQMVALVGPSGAGKTTVTTLLQRLYDVSAGSVLIDGRDIRRLKQRSIRYQIGVVLQDNILFSDTIRDNIAFGRPGATDEEIEAAARAANAHDFIAKLPDGYRTLVGDRGSRLSAGQRQRIAIARALLKDPPILILDEPTSALDAESEGLVQEALARLMKNRTTFVIAHRLSTVVDADRILVFKDGRILESGRHDELVASGGYYASLVERQVKGMLVAA